jgi:hypothetical protein
MTPSAGDAVARVERGRRSGSVRSARVRTLTMNLLLLVLIMLLT